MIVVNGLSHTYADGQRTLDNVSFAVQPGSIVGLLGPNGAGKTTLLHLLAGLLTPTAGTIQIAGLTLPRDRKQLPEQVGIVFADADDQLFAPTVLEDVAFGPLNRGRSIEDARNDATQALERVGLTGYAQRSPARLSAGEKRRAALAGVLAMGPSVILYDEPTQFLDPRGRRAFGELLATLPGTHFIATHDLDFVTMRCSRVIVLDAGQIVGEGPSAGVLADAEFRERHGLG